MRVGRDLGVFGGNLPEDASKEAVGVLHDVVLHKAGHAFAVVEARVLKGVAHNFLATGTRNEFEALHHLIGLLVLDAGIEVLFVFADDHHVHGGVLGGHKRVVAAAWTYVGKQTEGLAHGHVQALVPAPLRSGDGRLEQHFIAADGVPGFGANAAAVACEVHLLANGNAFKFQRSARGLQDAQGSIHDFWTDAVAVRDCDRSFFHEVVGLDPWVQGPGWVLGRKDAHTGV